jgi:hypothetical protein
MNMNPYEAPQHYSPSLGSRGAAAFGGTEFSIDCECGATIPVLASQAGGAVTCGCRRVVTVPRLSQLRRAKGIAPHDTNIRDTIARLIAEKHLPSGCCAVTELPTEDVMWFDIHCERTYVKGTSRWVLALLLLLNWPVALLMGALESGASAEDRYGREVIVAVPLKLCRASQAKIRRRASQRYLRKVLCTVPEYQELLREHPQARIYPQ